MASFKAKFPVLQELFAKNHRGALWPPPSGARVKGTGPSSISFFSNIPELYAVLGMLGTFY